MQSIGAICLPAAGLPGRIEWSASRVWFGVLLASVFAVLALPLPALAVTAHTDGATNADCNACHKPHQARMSRSLLSVPDSQVGAEITLTESLICYTCHGDSGGSDWNIQSGKAATGGINSFSASMISGHALEDSDTPTDLTNSCTSCHGVHGDPALKANLPANEQIAGIGVDPLNPRSWCLACHNAEHAWVAGYPVIPALRDAYEVLISAPTRDADTKYATKGTFPGGDHYATSSHAAIDAGDVESLVSGAVTPENVTRVAGDCLWCHTSHGSPEAWDGLLAGYRASTDDDAPGGTSSLTIGQYAQACFECHGNSTGTVYLPAGTYDDAYWLGAGAPDVYQYVSDSASAHAGHQIVSGDAFYAPGAPLPCYECHNPHGSKNGNALMISDALGSSLDPAASAVENRYFCFACHTTQDGGVWYGSDGTQMVVVASGTKAVGLDRTIAANTLTLSGTAPHSRTNTTQGCTSFGCHGSAHNPNGGVSTGGVACYGCHGVYEAPMEDSGLDVGLSYHHVLGSATHAGDYEFTATTYPTAVSAPNTDVYCLSCHVDHDKFYNGAGVDQKGFNLRSGLVGDPTAYNSDFNAADTDGGVCLGCHKAELTKDLTNQKPGTGTAATGQSAKTPIITKSMYGNRAHDYDVTSTYAGTANNTYRANCVKCHNDEEAQKTIGVDYSGYQTSSTKFGTHYSAENRLAAALTSYAILTAGMTSTEETLCFKCHDSASADEDGYSSKSMSAPARSVENYFTTGTYAGMRHDVVIYKGLHKSDENQLYISANKHVECEDCHNVHALGNNTTGSSNHATGTNQINQTTSPIAGVSGIQVTTWPTWTAPTGGVYAPITASAAEYQICFKCHSLANTSLTTWNAAWTNVALAFNPANRSFHPVVAALNSAGSGSSVLLDAYVGNGLTPENFEPGGTMYCSDCHADNASAPSAMGPHGSAIDHLLVGTWEPTSNATGYTLNTLSADFLCKRCHVVVGTNIAHDNHSNRGYACGYCHVAIPHGSKVPRLLATTSAPAPYDQGAKLVQFNYPIDAKGDCQALTGAANCGNAHSSAPPAPLSLW